MGARTAPNVYTPGSGDRLIPGATAIHEFFGFLGDCGQAAGEILYAWGQGKTPSGAHINAVVRAMQSAGLASASGVSTLQGNSAELMREGVPNRTTSDWVGAIENFAGVRPIELGVANAGALPGDELGVRGHFLTIEGWSPTHNAFIASDPDNAAAKRGQLVYYTLQQLQAAHPWGAIVPTTGGLGIQAGGGPGGGGGGNPGVAGAGSANQGAAAGAGAPLFKNPLASAGNPLDPNTWISAIEAAAAPIAVRAGFFLLALLLVALGILLVFWTPITNTAKDVAGGVGDAAKAAAVAA